ncbi:hypothetical protein F153LOC_08090 [Lelliottia sp. F153]|jgi:hypothetical protein|uniref:Imm15 family immunity protein n=1 Tax=unclassified Lelliottia TaxID=2642424 RepID=UPI000C7F5D34|nr:MULTISPECIES: Imm15 family immunity protein [unclassified Lelliottia]PLY45579.1 hypothetical protein F159LOC_11145 [Lelliottia sp. F159]PLY51740.1 hypothetical protein F154LOC_04140 [Lelliottia sp. F154]PLY55102.1 hypothetical protein F153LOC_08090 [Lelliottia sp. F153]
MSELDSKIKKILQNEGFYNDALYLADYDSFEEIPLFSRWKSVSFLKKKSFDENNKLLISHAVKLVEHALKVSLINAGKEAHEDFFCCVTLTKWDNVDEINCITPNIYITRRRKWLFSYINLKKTFSKEETLALKYIHELGLYNYDVYISGESDDIRRVYIINDIYSQIISPNDDVV